MIRLLIATLALIASLQPGGADETALAPDFAKMDWTLSEVDGKAPAYGATLNLGEAGMLAGQAPCNRYFATVTRDGTGFVPGAIAASRMACAQLAEEAEFLALLSDITTAEQGPGLLVLSGGGHEMRFVQPID